MSRFTSPISSSAGRPRTALPRIDEANNCFSYLEQQIAIIRPEFICLLGKVAVQAILNTTQAMGKMRGKWHRYPRNSHHRDLPPVLPAQDAFGQERCLGRLADAHERDGTCSTWRSVVGLI